MSEGRKGLTPEELQELVTVKLLNSKPTRKPEIMIFTVEFEGKTYRIGTIGKAPLESLAKYGYKEEGAIYLRIPKWLLVEGSIGWLNVPY